MTLLRYDLVTDPFPLRSSPKDGSFVKAQLTVVAANPSADPEKNPVTLQGLSITVPVGPEADKLAVKQPPLPVVTDDWRTPVAKPGEGVVEYVFTPKPGKGVIGKQGLVFVFNDIEVNTWPGPCQLTITEGTPGKPTQTLPVTKFPAGGGTVAFWVNPADIAPGDSTTLNWSGPQGATYSIEYYDFARGQIVNVPAQGQPALGHEGVYPGQNDPPLTPAQTTVFTLDVVETVGGVSYSAQQQATATVEVPPPSIQFTATPSVIDPAHAKPVRLQWETTNVSEIVIGDVGNYSGPQARAGSVVVNPAVAPETPAITYLATAYGLSGYAGPPALGRARVHCIQSKSTLVDVWNAPNGVVWSLDLSDGRPALQLKYVKWRLDDEENRGITMEPAQDGLMAELGEKGAATPYSELAKGDFNLGGVTIYACQLNLKNGFLFETNGWVGQAWGLKFPDGGLVLLWIVNSEPVPPRQLSRQEMLADDEHPQNWRFTFGFIDYTDLQSIPEPG